VRETTPGKVCSPPTPLPTLSRSLPVPLVHETRRFDGSTSPHDVEPFFFRDSCTGETRARVLPKLVEPGREERTTRVETTPHPKSQNPTPSHHGFDTTSSQSEQAGSTNFTTPKLVEPGRDEGATRVETTRQPRSRPNPKPPWFRHDQLAERAGRLNQLPSHTSRLSRTATKEQPESKPPGISSYPHPR